MDANNVDVQVVLNEVSSTYTKAEQQRTTEN